MGSRRPPPPPASDRERRPPPRAAVDAGGPWWSRSAVPRHLGRSHLAAFRHRRGSARPEDHVRLAGRTAAWPGAVAATGLQRFSGRQAVTCVCLLAMIFAGTAAVVWWSWETLQDRRLELGAQAQAGNDRPGSRTLTRDLVKRQDAGTGTRSRESRPLSADLERSTGSVRAVAPANISVDGRAVAVVVITAALTAATGASASVLRRYRRRTDRTPPVAHHGPSDGQGTAEAGVEAEAQEVAEAEVEVAADAFRTVAAGALGPAEADATGQVAAEPAVQDGLVVEQASLPAALVTQRQPDGDEDASGPVPRVLPPQRAASPVGMAVSGQPPESSTFAVTSDAGSRQRLYDRKSNRSVPYVHPAWLWWGQDNAPATVREVSLAGLRCLVTVTPDVGAAHGPGLGEEARMFFPVNGSTMKVNARVQWKEHTAEGMEVGLDFVGLSPEDSAALERLLVSMA